jgi:sec-independent protein translocase protein TatB
MHCRPSFSGGMMKRMSFSETIFLFFLALIIFGPKKLPEIARQVGKWMNEFRRASNEFKAQIEQEIAQLEIEERRAKILPPSPPPQGTASRALNAASSESSLAQPAPASAPAETGPAAVPASSADFDDEPLFARASATSAAAAAEPPADPPAAPPVADAAAASPSQESHA